MYQGTQALSVQCASYFADTTFSPSTSPYVAKAELLKRARATLQTIQGRSEFEPQTQILQRADNNCKRTSAPITPSKISVHSSAIKRGPTPVRTSKMGPQRVPIKTTPSTGLKSRRASQTPKQAMARARLAKKIDWASLTPMNSRQDTTGLFSTISCFNYLKTFAITAL